MQPVLDCRLRYELPHPFGDPFSGYGTAHIWVEIAFLERKIIKLRRKPLRQELLCNGRGVSICFGCVYRLRQSSRGLPQLDVPVHFSDEVMRHVQLAFAKDTSNTEHKPLLFRHLWIVDVESGKESIIVAFHLLAPFF